MCAKLTKIQLDERVIDKVEWTVPEQMLLTVIRGLDRPTKDNSRASSTLKMRPKLTELQVAKRG